MTAAVQADIVAIKEVAHSNDPTTALSIDSESNVLERIDLDDDGEEQVLAQGVGSISIDGIVQF